MNNSDLFNLSSSNGLLVLAKTMNIFSAFFIVPIGLIGHFLIIFVFGQKRFRTNSNNVFLFCLAINDSLFLIIHFFEDSIRNYTDIYINESNKNKYFNKFIYSLNLVDKYEIICLIINYLRYTLRFISSYILVVFSFQRLSIVNSPLRSKFQSKRVAWSICLIIVVISFLFNSWSPLIYNLNRNICEIEKKWQDEYIQITIFYIFTTICLPILIMFTCNLLIIYKLEKANLKRKNLKVNEYQSTALNNSIALSLNVNQLSFNSINNHGTLGGSSTHSAIVQMKPHYSSVAQIANRPSHKIRNNKYSTKILLIISFVFILLNIPYLIAFSLFYSKMEFNLLEFVSNDDLLAIVKICEILHVCNYAILFYVYCASGTKFRQQLKYSCEYYFKYIFKFLIKIKK